MRYVTALREGGSLPAIVEGSDSGLYVMKFRGAGQGVRALVAELICASLAKTLGLRVPELVMLELDASLGRNEADSDIRELLMASVGQNIGLDYLPGSMNFDPLASGTIPAAQLASDLVWFDALITNIDRTAKNPNLLTWHKNLRLIDHGAALYFHHNWDGFLSRAKTPFAPIRQHVALRAASSLSESLERLRPKLDTAALDAALDTVPPDWLEGHRDDYLAWFQHRLEGADIFTGEAIGARADLV